MRLFRIKLCTFQSLADDWTRHKFKEYAPYLGLFLI